MGTNFTTRDLTEQNPNSRIWDIVEKARVGMLTTQFGGGLRARPLQVRPDRDAGIIGFVTDVRGAKDDEIGAAHDVGLVFIDEGNRVYLSVTGRASVMRDAAKTKGVWKKTDDVRSDSRCRSRTLTQQHQRANPVWVPDRHLQGRLRTG